MKKVLQSVFLGFVFGLPAIFIFVLAGEALEVRGGNPLRGVAAGCLGVALYLAYCEFWVAPRGVRDFAARAPTVAATLTPLAMTLALFDRRAVMDTWIPMFAAGLVGSLAGAAAAGSLLRPARPGAADRTQACNRLIVASLALLVASPLVLALGVVRPVASNTSAFADPRSASMGLWVIAGLNLVAAIPIAFGAAGTRGRGRFSAEVLGFPAVLALLLGVVLLAPAVDYVAFGGPGMRLATALLFACAAFDLMAAALLTAAFVLAGRLPPMEPGGATAAQGPSG